MSITFNKEEHSYELDGNKLISVTQLLEKHGLTQSLRFVNEQVLANASTRGTTIHECLEDYLLHGEEAPIDEIYWTSNWAKQHELKNIICESIVHNDIVAGTYDCSLEIDGVPTLIDFKTTSAKHVNSWRWQLSLYNYLIKQMNGVEYQSLKVFWLHDGLEIVDIEPIATEEIEKLLQCERNGEFYKSEERNLVVQETNNELLAQAEEIERAITLLENKKKEFDERYKVIKESLLSAMESGGVTSFKTDTLSVTYVSPTESVTFDSERLKKDDPTLYAKYKTKVSKKKAYLRISLK